jgi:hypothetical protein
MSQIEAIRRCATNRQHNRTTNEFILYKINITPIFEWMGDKIQFCLLDPSDMKRTESGLVGILINGPVPSLYPGRLRV